MQRMETYLCSGERRRRRWRGGCLLLFPGVAPLSFGLFFFCRREMVASPFFFPSLFSFFPFEIVLGKKKNFWSLLSNSPALDEDYDGKGPGTGGWLDPSFLGFFALFLLWFCLCFSGFLFFCSSVFFRSLPLYASPVFSLFGSVNFCSLLFVAFLFFPPSVLSRSMAFIARENNAVSSNHKV